MAIAGVGLRASKQQGFTLIELMVVLAMIGALSVVFLIDIGGMMGKTHAVQHVRDIHALARAALKLEDALKDTANATTGGNMVIQAAFPHGGITQTSNSFLSAVGASLTVSWSNANEELSISNSVVSPADCTDMLKSINATTFVRIVASAGAVTNTLTRSNLPITLAVAAAACPATDATVTFVMKL